MNKSITKNASKPCRLIFTNDDSTAVLFSKSFVARVYYVFRFIILATCGFDCLNIKKISRLKLSELRHRTLLVVYDINTVYLTIKNNNKMEVHSIKLKRNGKLSKNYVDL